MATLMLFGHGVSITGTTFNFQRPEGEASTIYFWSAEGKPSKVYSDVMSSIITNLGAIPKGWAHERKSRIKEALVTDHLLKDPTLAPNLVPWLPANFRTLAHHTVIDALNGTLYHNTAAIPESNVMVFHINKGAAGVNLSTILANEHFNARALNIAWLVCRVD